MVTIIEVIQLFYYKEGISHLCLTTHEYIFCDIYELHYREVLYTPLQLYSSLNKSHKSDPLKYPTL